MVHAGGREIHAEKRSAQRPGPKADVPQSLLQVRDSPMLPAEAKAAIESFLAMNSGDAEMASPEANVGICAHG